MTVILVDGGNTHEVWVPLSLRWTWPVSGMQHTDGQTFQCNQLLQKSGCCWVHVWLLLSWCLDGLPKGLRLSLLGLFATWQSVRLCTGGSCMSCKLEKLCLKLGLEKKNESHDSQRWKVKVQLDPGAQTNSCRTRSQLCSALGWFILRHVLLLLCCDGPQPQPKLTSLPEVLVEVLFIGLVE